VKERASSEEIVAREAVARIRTWLRERGRGGKSASLPRFALKFCGGCNPTIERGTVAQRIQEGLSSGVCWVSAEEERDFILIINGCPTACANTAEIRGNGPAIVISGEMISP
jgi:hypothetical protein